MLELDVLSGGAAQGLVTALAAEFAAATGCDIAGVFGAVGAMRAMLAQGHAADVVILTSAIVRGLGGQGTVLPGTIVDIGGVETAIASREADSSPSVTDETSLRAAFLAADAIYVPDPRQATAGIHVADVLARLGIADTVASRLRIYPNGATAMRALAASADQSPIGSTQVTEIKATPGVTLVAPLPRGFDLTTVYSAGILASSRNRQAAAVLLELLTSPSHARLRLDRGFI